MSLPLAVDDSAADEEALRESAGVPPKDKATFLQHMQNNLSSVQTLPGEIQQLGLGAFVGIRDSVQKRVSEEVNSSLRVMSFSVDMDNVISTRWERISYRIENFVSTHPNGYFWLLSTITLILILILGAFWKLAHGHHIQSLLPRKLKSQTGVVLEDPQDNITTETERTLSDSDQYGLAIWQVFQVIASGGVDSSLVEPSQIVVYFLILLTGLIVFGILIGMITDSFHSYVEGISEGKTKVPISNHTLILGWNESTVRVVCQLALVRRQFRMQNETLGRTVFWWTRASPSTPVANAPIVLMSNSKTKCEMQTEIEEALAGAGISKKRTRVGRDIICRVGDPCVVGDLQRVGAHRAKAILVQMTEADREEFEINDDVYNAKSLRCLLALRVALFTSDSVPPWEDLRVVSHLDQPSKDLEVIQLGEAQDGRPVLHVQEMSAFVNSLMFTCVCQPGLAFSLLEVLSFKGNAFRVRTVESFPNKGRDIIGKLFSEVKIMWEDAAVVGVVEDGIHAMKVLPDQGMAISQDRIIGPRDRLIFICESSAPRRTKTTAFPAITGSPDVAHDSELKAVNILVCGWRQEWNDAARFGKRMRETCSELARGSRLKFLCMKPTEGEDSFPVLMERIIQDDSRFVSQARKENPYEWKFDKEIIISFKQGNATNYTDLERLFKRNTYDKAVVLSTVADVDLPPMSRDSRILSIMLHLRHLQMIYDKPPIHVIGENAVDSTSYLAMGPSSRDTASSSADLPDFVNVQAIYACALCQSLAYPRLQPHMAQLFSKEPGSPSLRLEDALSVLPAGCYYWGSVMQHIPASHLDPSDVPIGIRKNTGQVQLVPKLSEEINFEKGDKLIVISRSLSTFQQAEQLSSMSASQEEGRSPSAWRPDSPLSDMFLPGKPMM